MIKLHLLKLPAKYEYSETHKHYLHFVCHSYHKHDIYNTLFNLLGIISILSIRRLHPDTFFGMCFILACLYMYVSLHFTHSHPLPPPPSNLQRHYPKTVLSFQVV